MDEAAKRAVRAEGFRHHVIEWSRGQAALTGVVSGMPLMLMALSWVATSRYDEIRWLVAPVAGLGGITIAWFNHRKLRRTFVSYGPAGVWTGSAAVPWSRVTDVVAVRRLGFRSVHLRLTVERPSDPRRISLNLPPRHLRSDSELDGFVADLRAAKAGATVT